MKYFDSYGLEKEIKAINTDKKRNPTFVLSEVIELLNRLYHTYRPTKAVINLLHVCDELHENIDTVISVFSALESTGIVTRQNVMRVENMFKVSKMRMVPIYTVNRESTDEDYKVVL